MAEPNVEWLTQAFPVHDEEPATLALRLGLAFGLGCVVAGIYRVTRRTGSTETTSLVPTLVLLTITLAMVTLAVDDNVARAFSLVGALAIVRFRTVVDDARDTAFVIFAVAVGMAAGAGLWSVPVAGLPFAALAAFLFRGRDTAPVPGTSNVLRIRLGVGQDPETLLSELLARHLTERRLTGAATARQGAAVDLTYAVRLHDPGGAVALVAALNATPGVQEVELRGE